MPMPIGATSTVNIPPVHVEADAAPVPTRPSGRHRFAGLRGGRGKLGANPGGGRRGRGDVARRRDEMTAQGVHR
jgi:hypothetical protein